MRYYRYGAQPYQYEYNWKGYPMPSTKPPMMQFGDAKLAGSVLPLAFLGIGAYLVFIRKDKRGKTFFDRTVVDAIGGR
ncbi:MAG: hypothetical protein ACYSWU_00145 [Planctomycetota bacterium]|jgi:hypothetical protein